MSLNMIKRLILAALMCFSFLAGPLHAQKEKEVVQKYQAALKKSLDSTSILTMECQGTFRIQQMEMPASIYTKFPNLMRVEMSFQNVKFVQIGNDSVRWEYNPLENKGKLTRQEGGASGGGREDDPFNFVIYDLLYYNELGYRVKLAGKEKLDSLEVYRLDLTKKDKSKTRIYINTRTNLVYKVVNDGGYRYFANYTQQEGYVFPRYMSNSKNEGVVVLFKSIRFNGDLADSLFVIPKSAFEQPARPSNKRSDLVLRGDSLKAAGKHLDAISSYSKAIETNKEDYLAYNERGLLRIDQKEYYDAIADFNKVMEINPDFIMAYNNRGFTKYSMGDYAAAIKDYTIVLDKFPATVLTLRNRSLAYFFFKKGELAEQDLRSATKVDSTKGYLYSELGQIQAQLGKYEESLKSYETALQKKFTEPSVYNYRGVSEYKLKRYDSACVSFKTAVAGDPDQLQYIENYGRALFEAEHYDAAAEQFERVLKQDSKKADIQNLNGLCKYREENYKGAIKDFTKSIELNGKEATYYDNRASAKEHLEDYTGAIQDYGESIRIYPNDASVFYRRALVKLKTSKKMEGCLDLATANEMKYEPAKEAIMQYCN
jgi:tetratricopeptide (TPR) repeat protein